MKGDEVYRKLAERWGYSSSSRFLRILETIMTPEEGKLLLELPAPTPEELAKRLNADEESVKRKLPELARRGLVTVGKRGYAAPTTVVQLHDTTLESAEEYIPLEVYDLWKDFYYAEWREDLMDMTRQWRTAEGLPFARVLPSWKAIEASRAVRPEQVLPCEDMREVLRQILTRPEKLTVVACPCRRALRECDSPLGVCLQPKGRAEYHINRGAAKGELSLEEAIAVMDSAEEAGLVHSVGNNVVTQGVICNCCRCCCVVLNPLIYYGKLQEVMSSSRFRASVDEALCTGCQDCVERCPFGAIEMRKFPSSKRLKAAVDAEKCMGCGVCIFKCPARALTLELVRAPEHIPGAVP